MALQTEEKKWIINRISSRSVGNASARTLSHRLIWPNANAAIQCVWRHSNRPPNGTGPRHPQNMFVGWPFSGFFCVCFVFPLPLKLLSYSSTNPPAATSVPYKSIFKQFFSRRPCTSFPSIRVSYFTRAARHWLCCALNVSQTMGENGKQSWLFLSSTQFSRAWVYLKPPNATWPNVDAESIRIVPLILFGSTVSLKYFDVGKKKMEMKGFSQAISQF